MHVVWGSHLGVAESARFVEMMMMMMMMMMSNGRSWVYSISLLASQYSFGNSMEVWSSFGHTRR
jgi:hypothetical protein